jgi:hypothetical protein
VDEMWLSCRKDGEGEPRHVTRPQVLFDPIAASFELVGCRLLTVLLLLNSSQPSSVKLKAQEEISRGTGPIAYSY